MEISNFEIGKKVFIIAEMSANHGKDINIAKQTILAAKEAGADAIKIQTYTADTLTIDCDNEYFQMNTGTIWDGKTLYELYSEAYTPWEWQNELMDYAQKIGIIFFSTPFDKSAVDFLESIGVPAYKIASFEIQDLQLIEYVAEKGKPIIISTGIASEEDIFEAIEVCRKRNNEEIILLKCTSSYPADLRDSNLVTITDMKQKFKVEVGLSDHTFGIIAPTIAVALGATVIEKHFILDKSIGGPDAEFSLDFNEFRDMVNAVRETESIMGKVEYGLSEKNAKSKIFGRSLFVVQDIAKDEIFTEENIKSIRPSYGLKPKYLNDIIGRSASKDIKKGTPMNWDLCNKV